MAVYFILGVLLVAGSFAQAEDLYYYRPHLHHMDSEQVGETHLNWDQVKKGQESGTMSAVVAHDTKAFESGTKIWIDIPQGAELIVDERCKGWMNAFIQIGYGERANLYVREWDVRFHDKASGKNFIGVFEECKRPLLTRERILSAQKDGLVQVFTNKAVTLYSEHGPMVFVGPRFQHREDFTVEWMSRSTTGVLRIPAHRLVTLQGDPCRPMGQIKVDYAGGTYWVRALDLDITIAGEKLAITPLGSGAWVLCD
ncbi:MAG: hypothetical protein ACREJU_20060 [Nitrospiraceae bacterium]